MDLDDVFDLAGLSSAIGAQLGLADVKFMAWDPDFEEWVLPTDISELESGTTRLKLTQGSPARPTSHALPGSIAGATTAL